MPSNRKILFFSDISVKPEHILRFHFARNCFTSFLHILHASEDNDGENADLPFQRDMIID